MAQPNYIEIGEVCQVFQETTPPDITNVYFTAGSGLLKNIRSGEDVYYSRVATRSGGPIVNYADYKFRVLYDASLTRSGANQQNWRRIINDSETSVPTDEKSVIKSASTWPSATASVNGFSVTYGVSSETYAMNKATGATFENAIAQLVEYPPSVTDLTTFKFYLREQSNPNRYLSYSDGTFTSIDTGSATFTQSSITEFYFIINTVTNTAKELGLATSSSATTKILNTQIQQDYTIVISGVTYEYTTTPPRQQLVVPGALPSVITMIKSVTGKYLFWNGSYPGTFTLKDYWADSLTTNDIKRGLQFYFIDLTTQNAQSPTGGSVDFYRWNVINDATQPITIANTANVIVTGSSIQATQSAVPTAPAPSEGWTFNATGASGPPYHLVYVRETSAGSGNLNPVAYANIVSGGSTVSVVPISSIADLSTPVALNSKSWFCIKCSSLTGGICSVDPAATSI